MGINGHIRSCIRVSCINPNMVHVKETIMPFNETKIETIECNCPSEFQDKEYGEGRRIFTITNKDNKPGKRCTVCGRDK